MPDKVLTWEQAQASPSLVEKFQANADKNNTDNPGDYVLFNNGDGTASFVPNTGAIHAGIDQALSKFPSSAVSLLGAGAGAAAGGAIGNLPGALIGGLGAGLLSGIAGDAATEAAIKRLMPDFYKQLEVQRIMHPTASAVGSVASMAPLSSPFKTAGDIGAMASRLEDLGASLPKTKAAAMVLGLPAAIQAGLGVGGSLVSGQPIDYQNLAIQSLLGGALSGRVNKLGENVLGAGALGASRFMSPENAATATASLRPWFAESKGPIVTDADRLESFNTALAANPDPTWQELRKLALANNIEGASAIIDQATANKFLKVFKNISNPSAVSETPNVEIPVENVKAMTAAYAATRDSKQLPKSGSGLAPIARFVKDAVDSNTPLTDEHFGQAAKVSNNSDELTKILNDAKALNAPNVAGNAEVTQNLQNTIQQKRLNIQAAQQRITALEQLQQIQSNLASVQDKANIQQQLVRARQDLADMQSQQTKDQETQNTANALWDNYSKGAVTDEQLPKSPLGAAMRQAKAQGIKLSADDINNLSVATTDKSAISILNDIKLRQGATISATENTERVSPALTAEFNKRLSAIEIVRQTANDLKQRAKNLGVPDETKAGYLEDAQKIMNNYNAARNQIHMDLFGRLPEMEPTEDLFPKGRKPPKADEEGGGEPPPTGTEGGEKIADTAAPTVTPEATTTAPKPTPEAALPKPETPPKPGLVPGTPLATPVKPAQPATIGPENITAKNIPVAFTGNKAQNARQEIPITQGTIPPTVARVLSSMEGGRPIPIEERPADISKVIPIGGQTQTTAETKLPVEFSKEAEAANIPINRPAAAPTEQTKPSKNPITTTAETKPILPTVIPKKLTEDFAESLTRDQIISLIKTDNTLTRFFVKEMEDLNNKIKDTDTYNKIQRQKFIYEFDNKFKELLEGVNEYPAAVKEYFKNSLSIRGIPFMGQPRKKA